MLDRYDNKLSFKGSAENPRSSKTYMGLTNNFLNSGQNLWMYQHPKLMKQHFFALIGVHMSAQEYPMVNAFILQVALRMVVLSKVSLQRV